MKFYFVRNGIVYELYRFVPEEENVHKFSIYAVPPYADVLTDMAMGSAGEYLIGSFKVYCETREGPGLWELRDAIEKEFQRTVWIAPTSTLQRWNDRESAPAGLRDVLVEVFNQPCPRCWNYIHTSELKWQEVVGCSDCVSGFRKLPNT